MKVFYKNLNRKVTANCQLLGEFNRRKQFSSPSYLIHLDMYTEPLDRDLSCHLPAP